MECFQKACFCLIKWNVVAIKEIVKNNWRNFYYQKWGQCTFIYLLNHSVRYSDVWIQLDACLYNALLKGQLNSEWIYEVIVSCKIQTKKYKDFCPTKQTRIVAKKTTYTHQKITKNCYDPCLFGRAEIWKKFGWHFGRNDDLINLFWI